MSLVESFRHFSDQAQFCSAGYFEGFRIIILIHLELLFYLSIYRNLNLGICMYHGTTKKSILQINQQRMSLVGELGDRRDEKSIYARFCFSFGRRFLCQTWRFQMFLPSTCFANICIGCPSSTFDMPSFVNPRSRL